MSTRRTRIILADGSSIDFTEAQKRSTKFAAIVSIWLRHALDGRGKPSLGDVMAAVERCFPGSQLVDAIVPGDPAPPVTTETLRAAFERLAARFAATPEQQEAIDRAIDDDDDDDDEERELIERCRCIDCRIDTTGTANYYMVYDQVWAAAGGGDGMLCFQCLSRRLGRPLYLDDFTIGVPINYIHAADILDAIKATRWVAADFP